MSKEKEKRYDKIIKQIKEGKLDMLETYDAEDVLISIGDKLIVMEGEIPHSFKEQTSFRTVDSPKVGLVRERIWEIQTKRANLAIGDLKNTLICKKK